MQPLLDRFLIYSYKNKELLYIYNGTSYWYIQWQEKLSEPLGIIYIFVYIILKMWLDLVQTQSTLTNNTQFFPTLDIRHNVSMYEKEKPQHFFPPSLQNPTDLPCLSEVYLRHCQWCTAIL